MTKLYVIYHLTGGRVITEAVDRQVSKGLSVEEVLDSVARLLISAERGRPVAWITVTDSDTGRRNLIQVSHITNLEIANLGD
jgi:hypothetical protein